MEKSIISVFIVIPAVIIFLGSGSSPKVESVRDRLIQWRTGVWLSCGGTYMNGGLTQPALPIS